MIPIISVVGKTNSGKTTLIEKIIPELKKRGYKVGAVKHDVHQFEIDYEGKDTYRMAQSGADTVVIASDAKIAMIKNVALESRTCSGNNPQQVEESSLDKLAQWLFPDVDIVITEGYKKENKPKIEVTRSGELICNKDDNLFAVVANPSPVILSETKNLGVGFRTCSVKQSHNWDCHADARNDIIKRISNVVDAPCFVIDEAEKIVDLIEIFFEKEGIEKKC